MTPDSSTVTGTARTLVQATSADLAVESPGVSPAQREAAIASSAEHLWSVYRLNQDAIRFADTKAAAVLTADFAMAAAWASRSSTHHHIASALQFLFCISAVCVLISAAYCLWTVLPRLGTSSPPSLIYFGDIACHAGSHTYRESHRLACLNPETLEEHLIDQVWITSGILRTKFLGVRLAILWMCPSLVLSIIAIVAANW